MKLIKSVLLGTAAGFAATAGVQAADLPSRKAAPVDYVRVCTIGSFTGFVIPGTDICLKVGGFVRYNAVYNQPHWRAGDPVGSYGTAGPGSGRNFNTLSQQAVASIKMDARQTTEYGLLRSFFDVRVGNSGNTGGYNVGSTSASAGIDKAYIQFGGLFAGRTQSSFDFYADDASYGSAGLGSDHNVVGIGYSFKFAEGFYATIALEDPRAGDGTRTPGLVNYGGQRVPDIIGAVGVEQSWGSAKLSGAVHQVWTGNSFFVPPVGLPSAVNNNTWGYAIQGGVAINIPQLGPSDKLWLQAAYASGASIYLGLPGTSFGNLVNSPSGYNSAADFAYNAAGGTKLTTGWNVTAAFEHMWNPNWGTNIFGGYTQYTPGNNVFGNTSFFGFGPNGAVNGGPLRQADVWQVGGNVTWYPVKGLKIAGEVTYFDTKLNQPVILYTGPNGVITKKSENTLQGYVRIQRDF